LLRVFPVSIFCIKTDWASKRLQNITDLFFIILAGFIAKKRFIDYQKIFGNQFTSLLIDIEKT